MPHAAQDDLPEAEYQPAEHAVQLLAPAKACVPAGHGTQVVDNVLPDEAEKVPAAHAVQELTLYLELYVPEVGKRTQGRRREKNVRRKDLKLSLQEMRVGARGGSMRGAPAAQYEHADAPAAE